MTTDAPAVDALLEQYEGAWRDNTPIFACCRRSIHLAAEHNDLAALAASDPTTRVMALRAAVELEQPGHLEGHRCCVGHLADLAFDLPSLVGAAA